ncbi:MAG: hypothetical protein RBR50_01100 [Candidatus Izemoplasmatales bacterium]|nr:hypothetical protein [Candidatus Izemoplasmatales bacterium]
MKTRITDTLTEPRYEHEIINILCSDCTKAKRDNIKKWLKQLIIENKIKIENGRYVICKA